MSARAIRRHRERELARRSRRRARTTLATGAALGATALFAPAADAATITVTSLADDGGGADKTLREAVVEANASPADDTIVFESGLSGEITLTGGPLEVDLVATGPYASGGLTIDGPGAGVLSISGDANDNDVADSGDSRIIESDGSYIEGYDTLAISDVTLTEGYAEKSYIPPQYYCTNYYYNPYTYDYYCIAGYFTDPKYNGRDGGAIDHSGGDLILTGVVLTDNLATDDGGAMAVSGDALTLTDTVVEANVAYDGGGGLRAFAGDVTITDSEISDNVTTGYYVYYGEFESTFANGASVNASGGFSMTNTTLTGNSSTSPEGSYSGALDVYTYAGSDASISGSTIGGNHDAGGLRLDPGTGHGSIVRTNVVGNDSNRGPGGLHVWDTDISLSRIENNVSTGYAVGGVRSSGGSTISQTTIAGNVGRIGGLETADRDDAPAVDPAAGVRLVNSTVSGNSATETPGGGGHGGGILAQGENGIQVRNSTIVGNSADVAGGGIYSYAPEDVHYTSPYGSYDYTYINREISSSIVANNTAAGAPNDLATGGDQGDTVGFDIDFSLIETPGSATLAPASVDSIFGVDPQLGPLQNNGGVNRTHLPAGDSPVIDQGKANGLTVDQRNADRTVDLSPANAADGTDIGAVEATVGPDEGVDGDVDVDKSQKLKKKLKLKIDVACEEACTASSDGTVSVGGGGKGRILFKAKKHKLKEDSANLAAGESETLVLKLDGSKKKVKKATKKIKKAIKKGKKVKANVTTVITDGAGNSESQTDKIKIT
jgi:CSLREA domain-containing protein